MSHQLVSLRLRVAALAVLASAAWTVGAAQIKGNFEDADTNHDGRVTFEEFSAYARQQLNNADGRKARRFKRLSDEQKTALLHKRFEQADRSHRGYLDRSDWTAPRR